jgi:hypothetical protein
MLQAWAVASADAAKPLLLRERAQASGQRTSVLLDDPPIEDEKPAHELTGVLLLLNVSSLSRTAAITRKGKRAKR